MYVSDIFEHSTHLANEERNFSCASRAAFASSSSYRLQLYHDEPCGSHDPKHTQQKSCLQFWFLHTMWLQPPSFSIVTLHLGHSLVLAAIQLDVSESSSHFLIHFFSQQHLTGSCQFSPHAKQKTCPHLQLTGRESPYDTLIAYVQSTDGHQRNSWLHSTKLFVINCWYFTFTRGSTSLVTVTSSTKISQPCAAHEMDWPRPSVTIFVVKYSRQQAKQKRWPHSRPVMLCNEAREKMG